MGLVFEIEKAMTFVLFIVRMSAVLAGVNRLNDVVGNYKGGSGLFSLMQTQSVPFLFDLSI